MPVRRGSTRNLSVVDDPVDDEVEARTQDAKVVVTAGTAEGRTAELRLYHNGKLLSHIPVARLPTPGMLIEVNMVVLS